MKTKHPFTSALACLLAALMLLAVFPFGAALARTETEERQPEAPGVAKLTPSYTVSEPYQGSKYYTRLCNVQLTGDQRSDILKVAYSQLGYLGGSCWNDLDGERESGVAGKHTEYGYYFGNYAEWCAMFVSWCARQARINTSVIGDCAAAWPEGFHVTEKLKADYFPQPGDLIFYHWRWDPWPWEDPENGCTWSHVGIVYDVDEATNTIWTIEGNYSNTVIKKKVSPTSEYSDDYEDIYSFGVPNYNGTYNKYDPNNYNTPSENVFLTNGSSGNDVRWAQACLYQLGYDCDVDGQYGPQTQAAVESFQSDNGLTVTGNVGKNVRAKLIELLTVDTPLVKIMEQSNESASIRLARTGTTVYYTLNGSNPDPDNPNHQFTDYFTITSSVTIRALATKPCRFNSPVRIIKIFTVTFKDYDGTVLKRQFVIDGKAATAPSNPTRPGYAFTGWNKDFSEVTSNMTVTAQYSGATPGKPKVNSTAVNTDGSASNASSYNVTFFRSFDDMEVLSVTGLTSTSCTVRLPAGRLYAVVTAVNVDSTKTTDSNHSAAFIAPIIWTCTVNEGGANMNEGPGGTNEYPKVKFVSAGKTVYIREMAGAKLSRGLTTYGGATGWIYYGACTDVQNPTWVYMVNSSQGTIIMRAEESLDSEIVAYPTTGTLLTATELHGNRAKVTYNGITGWITVTFCIRVTDPTVFTAPAEGEALSLGAEGDKVRWLQACLWQMGYFCELNGVYDTDTEAALSAFKARHSLSSGTGFNAECRAKLMDLFTIAKPTMQLSMGSSTTTVTLACSTNHSRIYYTTDGSEPTADSTLYEIGQPITVPNGTTVKAIGANDCRYSSAVFSQTVSPDLTVTYTGAYTGTVSVPYGGDVILPVLDAVGVHYVFTVNGQAWTGTNITADVTVTVEMEIDVYTVSFKDPVTGAVLKTQQVQYGEAASAPDAPEHYGYTFSGWDNAFGCITGDMIILAVYDPDLFTVIFMDGCDNLIEVLSVPYHTAAPAPGVPDREGWTFTGWDVDFSSVEHDMIVNATWSRNYYTVTFTGVYTGTVTVEHGCDCELPVYNSNTVHYTFKVNGEKWDGRNITADVTVTVGVAVSTKFTVTFLDHDGTILLQQEVMNGDAAEAPEDPEREGWTFVGWDADFSEITADLTVNAQYTINSYTLTIEYVFEDGTSAGDTVELVLEYGEEFAVETPELEGYTADTPIVSGTMGADNAEVVVTYTEAASGPSVTLPGDVDLDGEVTAADALLAMRCAMSIITLEEQGFVNGDMDGDGLVTANDAIIIMRVVLGIR